MDRGWIGIQDSPIAAGGGRLIAYHIYSGVMVVDREEARRNPFITHWQEINDEAWIEADERKPTREDADKCGIVISQDRWGEVKTAGWHRFGHEKQLTHWQPPPHPPQDCGLQI